MQLNNHQPFTVALLLVFGLINKGSADAQRLADYQNLVTSQFPSHYFKLDASLTDFAGNAGAFGVLDTGGGDAEDFFGNANTCRFFSNLGDALTNSTDLIPGGGAIGGDPSATNQGTVTLLFRTLDAATNTGQRFVFSQGNTTANANAFGLFFENDTSSDPNSLKLRVSNVTRLILPATNLAPNAWYYLAVTYTTKAAAAAK